MLKGIDRKIEVAFLLAILLLGFYTLAFVNRTVGPVIYPGQGLITRGSSSGVDSIHVIGGTGITIYQDSMRILLDTTGIMANGVGYINLKTGSVTSAKILDGTIATADIAASAITGALIATNAIDSTDIANGNIMRTVKKSGSPSLKDSVLFTGSGGVTLTQTGNTIDIGMTGGGFNYIRASGSAGIANDSLVLNAAIAGANSAWFTIGYAAGPPKTITYTFDTTRVINWINQKITDSLHVSIPLYPIGFVPAIGQYITDSISVLYAIGNDTIPGYLWHVNIANTDTGGDDCKDTIYYKYRIPQRSGTIDSMTMNLKTSSTTQTTSNVTYKVYGKTCTPPCYPDLVVPLVDLHAGAMAYASDVAGQWIHKSVVGSFSTTIRGDIVIVKAIVNLDRSAFAGYDEPVLWVKGR